MGLCYLIASSRKTTHCLIFFTLLLVAFLLQKVESRSTKPKQLSPRPILLLPGFASSQLYNWKEKDCPGPINFNVGDRVWIDVTKVFSAPWCWLDCILLDTETQTEVKGCKARPGEGLHAIHQLDPGMITGPLSNVWGSLIDHLAVTFGYEPDTSLLAAPFDWRLPPYYLHERDNFFLKLMNRIEVAEKSYSKNSIVPSGIVVIAHSMGNNVFRYFIEWLKHEKGLFNYKKWLQKHILSYVAVGAPMLGSVQTIRGILNGFTYSLPISLGQARKITSSFGSTPWLLPFLGSEKEDETTKIPLVSLKITQPWAKTSVRIFKIPYLILMNYGKDLRLDMYIVFMVLISPLKRLINSQPELHLKHGT
eukprot:TRINITY_DN8664_c0_g1_i1.p1 TRINITY_DN8664_c0_g1~~TRINITY_DN8664_c0_g1_i1.p1  ORF type:complete len:364 (+),score=29.98 TRINITY_DN8664_c0_g1_i1:52-1143(+)